jgi:peptidoglycan lytic transglycosylase G
MTGRGPANHRADPYFSRTSGPLVRSPAERLEPTRPPARPRHRRLDSGPRRMNPALRVVSGVFTFILLMMLLVGGIAFLFDSQIDAAGPLERTKVVVIPKGEGAHEIAARLEREGVVSDRRLFIAGYLWTRFAAWLEGGKPVQLRAGDFEVKQYASVRQLVDLLSEGKTVTYRVTIPEGLTSHQIVERLRADQNLGGEITAVPPEGSLLPETFIVQRGAARQAVIDGMVAEQRKLIERTWAQRRKDLALKTPEEAIILASIVEKETGRNDERTRVAAVFHNRLKHNMRLQSDPTILYGLHGGKAVWNRPIMKSDKTAKTLHNTYEIDGLPPTPICNPGRAAIEAVLNPADTKDLYFVADGSGGHIFAETLKDHNANVLKWRAVEKEIKAKATPVPGPGDTPATSDTPATPAKTRAVVRTPPPAKAQPAPQGKEPRADQKGQQPAASAPGPETKAKP